MPWLSSIRSLRETFPGRTNRHKPAPEWGASAAFGRRALAPWCAHGRGPAACRRGPLEGLVEHLIHLVREEELDALEEMLRELVEIRLVQLGRDHAPDAGALGGQRLLLEPSDRKHLTGERHLAGHGGVRTPPAPGDPRHEHGHPRYPRARAV